MYYICTVNININNKQYKKWTKKLRQTADRFKKYLSSLERMECRSIKKQIMAACHIEYPTIDNWRYNICNIHPLAKEKIEEIAGVKIFGEE